MAKRLSAFSGKFVLRIPSEFHRELSLLADQSGASLNQFCFEKIKTALTVHPESSGVSESPSFQKVIVEELFNAGIPLIGVVLFGSAAREEVRDSSDIDLLLVVEKTIVLSRELYRLWDSCLSKLDLKLNPELTSKLSPQFVHLPGTPLEAGSLWFESAIEGLILSDTEFRIAKFLSQIRVAILQGKIKRDSTHGHHYWIKNIG